MVQAHPAGQATLRQKPQMRDGELVELGSQSVSGQSFSMGSECIYVHPPPSEPAAWRSHDNDGEDKSVVVCCFFRSFSRPADKAIMAQRPIGSCFGVLVKASSHRRRANYESSLVRA